MQLGVVFLVIAAVISGSQSNHTRTKRMYGMCPPNFYRIGSACYFISTDKLNWLDAHFECRDKNSKLAEPAKVTDRQLRKYLIAGDKNRDDIWIGGTYEWNKHKWEWGYSGNEMQYQSFSQMDPGSSKDLHYHCAVLNPELDYRWSARPCADTHRFICQHKMPKVSAKNRLQVYQRWNETFPNQKANEVILNVVDGAHLPRKHRRGKIAVDNNETVLGDSPNVNQNKKLPTDVTATTRHGITRPGQKRSQWPPQVNSQNNETIEKPTRRRTAFDKIAERKRQKEMKRRRRMQQKRKQKAIEAENRRKAKEAARMRPNDTENFPPPITEILMFPEITPEVFATKSTPRVLEAPKTTTERTTTSTTIATSTTTTTTEAPIQPHYEIKPIGEKRFFDNEAKPNRFEQQLPSEDTEKYTEYLKKLEERSNEQQKRIEEEERKRQELKKSREAEIERLKKLYDEQKEEEERLAADVKQREEEERKIQQEEDRVKMEKAKKEADEERRALAKQAARIEALRRVKEKIRKDKEEKLRLALSEQSRESNNSAGDNETDRVSSAEPTDRQVTEEEKKMRFQKLKERLEKLTPEQRKKFHEMRMQRKKQKLKRSHTISKRSIIIP